MPSIVRTILNYIYSKITRTTKPVVIESDVETLDSSYDDEETSVCDDEAAPHSNGDVAPAHPESRPVDLFSLQLQVYASLGRQQQQKEQQEAKLVSLLHAYMQMSDATASTEPRPIRKQYHIEIPRDTPSFDYDDEDDSEDDDDDDDSEDDDDNVVVLPSPRNLRSNMSTKYFPSPRNPRKYFWSRFFSPAAKTTPPPTVPVDAEVDRSCVQEEDDCEFVIV